MNFHSENDRLIIIGVQKISKIVINRSVLITRFAVERLYKNKHFKKKKKNQKKCVQNFEWLLKNGLKGIYYLLFGNDLTKTSVTKKMRKG